MLDRLSDSPIKSILFQKLQVLGFHICFIMDEGVDYFPTNFTFPLDGIFRLRQAWQLINRSRWKLNPLSSPHWSTIYEISENIPHLNNSLIRRFRAPSVPDRSIIILGSTEAFPWFELHRLINIEMLLSGRLPLHSGAVAYRDQLFLFSGSSGAGKSTICAMSRAMKGEVLDEDQVLIRENPDHSFSADAWGYSLKESAARIHRFYLLSKDTKVKIESVATSSAAKFLTERTMEMCGRDNPPEIMKKMFALASHLARSVPGYNLHFRKSPDFWRLITEESHLD